MYTFFFKMVPRTLTHLFANPLPQELENAIKNNQLSEFETIIKFSPALVHSQNNCYETPLHLVINYSPADGKQMVNLLIQHGAKVDAENHTGSTPLFMAAYRGNLALAELLLQKGANVNHQRDDGESPLMEATIFSSPEMVELLTRFQANPNIKDDWRGKNTPLHYAAEMGDIKMMEILLNAGADINAKTGYCSDGNGQTQTPLRHLLSLSGIPQDAREILLSYFKNPPSKCHTETRGDYAYTPLHLAALYGHTAAVKLLLQPQLGVKLFKYQRVRLNLVVK